MKHVGYLIASGLLAIVVCCTPEQRNEKAAIGDKKGSADAKHDSKTLDDFLEEAIETLHAEMRLAELASTKSSNKRIVAFAQEMANDHTNTLTILQAIAEKNGVVTPRQEGDKRKEVINELAQQRERAFEQKWLKEIDDTHKQAIRDLEEILQRTDDPQMKEIIDQSLDVTRARLTEFEELANSINTSR